MFDLRCGYVHLSYFSFPYISSLGTAAAAGQVECKTCPKGTYSARVCFSHVYVLRILYFLTFFIECFILYSLCRRLL